MFSLRRCYLRPAILNYVRKYCDNLQPVQLSYNVFESPRTDANVPPLFIMHGLFGSKQNWRSVCNGLKLNSNRKIYALDARNHGESPHTNEHGSRHMTADVIHLMQQLNIKKVATLGHSMGGRTMMYMALRYPELVERMVVVDISPVTLPRDFNEMEKLFAGFKSLNIPKELSLGDGRKYAEKKMAEFVDAPGTVKFILMNLKKNQDGSFRMAFNSDVLYKKFGGFHSFAEKIAGLKPYKGEVLFICGSRSNFVDPQSEPNIKAIFPNARFEWLDTGHLVHMEEPKKFLAALIDFLNK